MCNLSQGVLEKGMEKGMETERIAMIKRLLNKGKSTEQIVDLLDMELSYVKQVQKLLKDYPDKSEKELANLL